jgi:hypothetical protein
MMPRVGTGGVDGRDDRGDGVPADDDGRAQPRLFSGAVYAVGDAFDVVGRSRRGCAVTGKVESEDPPAGVNAAQLGERWPPQAAVEGQGVEQDQRRPGAVVVVSGESARRLRQGRLRLRPLTRSGSPSAARGWQGRAALP